MTRIRSLTVTLGLGVAMTLAACGDGPPGGATGGVSAATTFAKGGATGTPVVTVHETDELKFDAASVTVKVNDIVKWDNSGSVPHTLTFNDDSTIGNDSMQGGDTWQIQFTKAGTYQYVCTFHAPGMAGTVVVQ